MLRHARLRRSLVVAGLALFFVFGLALPMLHVVKGAFFLDDRFTFKLFTYVISPGLVAWTVVVAALGAGAGALRAKLRRLPKADMTRAGIGWGFYGAVAGFLLGLVMSAGTVEQECIRNSALLGLAATVIATAIALPLSYAAARFSFRGKAVLTGLILVPMIMPPFVGAIGMRRVLGRFGIVNLVMMHLGIFDSPADFLGSMRFWGVAVLEALHLYPIMFLNLTAAFANIDPAMEEAAESLGDSGFGLFRRVTLPLLVPGLFAGGSIVFVWAFTDLGTPLIFEYHQVVAKQIYDAVIAQELNRVGYAMVLVVLATSGLMFLAARRVLGGRSTAMLSRGATSRPEVTPAKWLRVLVYAGFGGTALVALLPHLSVLLTAFSDEWFMSVLPSSYTARWMGEAISDPRTTHSIKMSLGLALGATAIDVALGIGIAWFVTRSRSRLAPVVDAVSMAPLAIPGVVIAFGYVGAYSGLFSGWSDAGGARQAVAAAFWYLTPRNNPIILLVLAYSVRRLPYMVRAAAAGFQQTAVELEEASLNLGAGNAQTLRRITLPLIGANVIAGAVLAFSFAMLEVSDSLILAMKENFYPITKQIYHLFNRLGDGPMMASALGVIGMLILAGSLMVASSFMGRRLGQMFRIG